MTENVVHSLSLIKRSALNIKGVVSVLIFDSDYILIELENDKLSVEGSDLKLVNLIQEKKEVEISGKIKGIFYQDGKTKKIGFLNKK